MQENVFCFNHGVLLLKSILSHLQVALGGYFGDMFIRWHNVSVRFVGCTQKFSVVSKLLMHLAHLWALLASENLVWYFYAVSHH